MRRLKHGLVATALAAAACSAGAQAVQVSPANRTIAITTTENAERRAEVASLHVGYHIYAPDSAHAYSEAARISQAVTKAIEETDVPKDAISSENQSTGQTQDFRSQELTPDERAARRFEAQQTWTVKTTPDAVARVLAAAVAAGANESGAIDWSLVDEASLTAEAATKALAHARKIAGKMADGLGAKVGNLLYASNQVETAQPIRVRQFDRIESMAKVQSPPRLSLSAPMITRTATVVAIFTVQ